MARNTGLNIVIAGDAKGATRAFRQVRGEAVGLDDSLTKAKNSAQAVMAAYAGARFFTDAVQSASDLEEASAKVNQVFGGSSDEIQRWSESSATAFGLSRSAALEAAGTYGNLFQAFGVGQDRATAMSTSLVELAADLASFDNTSVGDALVALRSGLAGEIEPMRRYGAELTAAALREQALAMGLEVGTGALNARTKALAAYEIIMRDTELAQDDFSRNSDGLANQQRILAAEWENAKAELGTGLMPVMKAGVTVGRELAQAWGAIPGPVQVGILAFGGLALVLPKVAAGAKAAKVGFGMFQLGLAGVTEKGSGAGNALGGLVNRMGGVRPAAGAAAVGVGVLGAALAAYMIHQAQVSAANARFKAEVEEIASAALDAGKTVEEAFRERLARAAGESDIFEDLNIDLAEAAEAAEAGGKAWDAYVAKLDGTFAREAAGAIKRLYDEAVASTERQEAARTALNVAEREGAETSTGVASATDKQTSALDRATAALDRIKERQEGRLSTARALADAERATAEALGELAEVQETAAGRGEEVREAQEGVTAAREREVEASRAVADAQRRLTEAQGELNEAYATARDRMREKALAAREAADAEAGAVIAVARAEKELERLRAGGADELSIREAEQKLRESRTAVESAKAERREADVEAAKGIDQDEEVVRAKEARDAATRAVADAERQQAEARKATGVAERQVASVIEAAKAKVEEATRKVREAATKEAEAAGDAAEAQHGAGRGAIEHAKRLRELAALFAPGSQERKWLEEYVALLERAGEAADIGGRVASGSTSLAAAEAEIRRQQESTGGRGANIAVTQNLTVAGTPAETRRAVRDAGRDVVDEIARKVG